jgi:hypothetical protein
VKFKDITQFAAFLWPDAISPAQVVVLKCLYGLPLSFQERAIWRKYAGTRVFARYTPKEFLEAVLLLGRQSGKSAQLGTTIVLWESLCVQRRIPEGQRQTALILTPSLKQSTFGKITEKLRSVPEFLEMVEAWNENAGLISLRNGVDIQAVSAIPRFARGFVAFLALLDEAAYFHQDNDFVSNLPELLEAVRPALITTNGKLFMMSSPSGKEGVLWEAWENRNENPDVFIFKAPSEVLNPAIPKALLERERKRGSAYWEREFMAEFTESVNPFVSDAALAKCINTGRQEIEWASGDSTVAGIDLADKRDDCALVISGVRILEGRPKVVVLFAKAWKPGPNGHVVPEVLREMGEICKRYHCYCAKGDQKSMSTAEFILGKYNVDFKRTVTAGAASEPLFRTFLGLVNSGEVALLDQPELLTQIRRLEERVLDGNRFLVAGRRNSKDDLAVACVLSVAIAAEGLQMYEPQLQVIDLSKSEPVDFNEVPFGPGDELYPPSHRFGPERWWIGTQRRRPSFSR